jgi:hypothetical protein
MPIGQVAVTSAATRKAAKTSGKTAENAVGTAAKKLQKFFRGATV